jgi:hypothetical protein
MKLEFSQQNFHKDSNISFQQNPSRGIRVVPYGRTDGHDELTVSFRNFSNAPKNVNTVKFTVERATE